MLCAMDHRRYYRKNKKYSDFLDSQTKGDFLKYADYAVKYTKDNDRILDVGCGTGIAIELIKQSARRRVCGIDISSTSVQKCKQKRLECQVYDGNRLPFSDGIFDLVGSINVLEHTNDPIAFLEENMRVIKSGGHLIIVCPNFLSITNGYHHHTRGAAQKIKNILSMTKLFMEERIFFDKMNPVIREDFKPDDDAVNATNPISLFKWIKSRGLEVGYWSGQSLYKGRVFDVVDRSFLKIFLGSSFVVLRKS